MYVFVYFLTCFLMKNLSKVSLIAVFLFICMFGAYTSAVYYDAETNSYVYDDEVETPTTDETTETDTSTEEETTGSVDAPFKAFFENMEEEDEETVNFSGSLEYLHRELVDHKKQVILALHKRYYELYMALEALPGGKDRFQTFQCLGWAEKQAPIGEVLKTSYQDLVSQMRSVSDTLHDDIDDLEGVLDDESLEAFQETLEIASLQNKVDAYANEYTNMVNAFYEVADEEITNTKTLITTIATEKKDELVTYDKREALYKKLLGSYETFLQKVSFAEELVEENFADLEEIAVFMKAYHVSLLAQKRFDEVTVYLSYYGEGRMLSDSEFLDALETFEEKADEAISSFLTSLYPEEDLSLIHQGMDTLSIVYTDGEDVDDCEAFMENDKIDLAAPALENKISKVIEALNIIAHQVAIDGELPKDDDELKQGVRQWLEKTLINTVEEVFTQHQNILKTSLHNKSIEMLGVRTLGEADEREDVVRTFLQTKYSAYLEKWSIKSFVKKLERADAKIEKLLPKASGKTKRMLEVIGKVIGEFID